MTQNISFISLIINHWTNKRFQVTFFQSEPSIQYYGEKNDHLEKVNLPFNLGYLSAVIFQKLLKNQMQIISNQTSYPEMSCRDREIIIINILCLIYLNIVIASPKIDDRLQSSESLDLHDACFSLCLTLIV